MKPQKYLTELSLLMRPQRFFLLFAIVFFYSFSCYSQPGKLAKKGVLDLGNWDWKTNGIANLDGEWEFYWNTLYDPSKQD
ncbi:MAG: hypothetical protein ABI472_25415, partial [Ginsengibacter sp.]